MSKSVTIAKFEFLLETKCVAVHACCLPELPGTDAMPLVMGFVSGL